MFYTVSSYNLTEKKMNQNEQPALLEIIGLKMSSIVQIIKDRYPSLNDLCVIQRLVVTSDLWEKEFSRIYSKERS